jgi:CubicO group peptidase (beta-lactamase class C family)
MTTILPPFAHPAALRLGMAALGTLLAAAPAQAQISPTWAPVLDSVVNAALASSRAPGATVAVVSNGQLVYAKGYGLANVETQQPMTADMLLRVGSVTKMFTGATLATLVESGKLDMNKPIAEYIPSLAGKRVGTVTTQQLMTHSAGWLDNAVAYGRMGEGALGEVMREVSDTMFFTDAGRTFSYSNPSISMAGYVAEMAGKQRFASLTESLVMRPTGMKRSTFKPLEALTWPTAMGHEADGANAPLAIVRPMTENTAQWAAGFLFSTAPELARFSIALMTSGASETAWAIRPAVVKRMTTGYVPHPGGSGLDSAMYGYGLVVGNAKVAGNPERVWTHAGSINGYNAQLTMIPARRTSVVILVNGPGSGIGAIESKALELAMGAPLQLKARTTPRQPTAAERARLIGRYAMNRTSVELFERGDSLFMRQGDNTMPVQHGAAGELFIGGTRLAFYRLENGKVVYVYNGSRALARQP